MAELDYSSAEMQPNPNEKLVKVLDAATEAEALVVKGLLESAGIDSDLTAAEDADIVHRVRGLGGTDLLVREEDAEEARRLIAAQQQTPLADDVETAEIETTEEPPPKP
jgi:hypothetical protein